MTFQYPLGLLGLIGIPILIIVYIIRSKYTEQTVASTYLWTLSEKFLKRRNPLSKLTGLIALILQLLAVTAISLTIAHPIFTVPDSAREYCFILDGSGSMNMDSDGTSRFERGKDEIRKIITESTDGSEYSLVYVGSTTSSVFTKTADKELAITLLDALSAEHSGVNYSDAIATAQRLFNENNSLATYLVTDTEYETLNGITLINVSTDVENYSISDLTYVDEGDTVTVYGKLRSYKSGVTLNLRAYTDGEAEVIATQKEYVEAGGESSFYINIPVREFDSIKVEIVESDAYALDNTSMIYNLESENSYKTLLVSDYPFFFKSVLTTMTSADVEVVSPSEYKGGGYGLYIFDSFSPQTLPTDGAVWFINPVSSVDGAGFSVKSEGNLIEGGDRIVMTSSTSTLARQLTENLDGSDIYISRYVKCGQYNNYTNLFTYNGNPIIFSGSTDAGNREVVFAFDIHDSNFALTADFGFLVSNLLQYSFPPILEKTDYKSGEVLKVNVLAGCETIQVDTPLGNVEFLSTASAVAELTLTEAGVYTITLTSQDSVQTLNIFSEAVAEESEPMPSSEKIGLQGEAGTEGMDGYYDNIMIFFICLAVLFLADWMVYCYEKYQLR
ncbi:MAG: VWA domain-containing protein [Clostridia bacterium]|nr:VWA domain-containing protein [Clostridia bacterium]